MSEENSIAYHIGLLISVRDAVKNLGNKGLRVYEMYDWRIVAEIAGDVIQFMSKLEAMRLDELEREKK